MKSTLERRITKPYLYIKNNIVFEVNRQFEYLTGYSSEELLGKSIAEINNMLRTESQILLQDIVSEQSCYIFTKEHEPREVNISRKIVQSENEQIYFMKEKYNSRIEDRISYIASLIPDTEMGVAVYSIPNLIILKVNEKFASLNYNECSKIENCLGKNVSEVSFEYKASYFENDILNVIRTGKPCHMRESKYKCHGNWDNYMDASIVPIFVKGKVKYIVHTVIDVTETVAKKNFIEEQKQEFEAVIEGMSDEVIIYNKDLEYVKMNKLARENNIFYYQKTKKLEESYKQAQIYRQAKIYDIEGNPIEFKDLPFQRVFMGEKCTEFRYDIRSSKGIINKDVNVTPIYDSEGNIIAGVLVFHDITDRLKYHENLYLKVQYESLHKVIENLDLGIARYSYPEFNFIEMNNKAYNLIKKLNPNIAPKASIKSNGMIDGFYGGAHIIELINSSLFNNSESCFEECKFNIEGEDIYLKFIYQPLLDLNNEIVEIVVIGFDITEDIKTKNMMEDSLKIQDEIYANVSHELKTPLNVIFSANQMMDIYLKSDSIETNSDKLLNYNKSIKQNCYRLIKLINNIVDTTKSKSGLLKLNLNNEDIVNIVENIVQSVSEYVKSRGLGIIFNTNVEKKIIACDPSRIERVMLNLISNAIKFSNQNDQIYVNILDKGNIVEISVRDTGVGIEKEHLDSIFNKFYQEDKTLSRNAEGSGIGLSLIKSIVELHDGNIRVESEIDKGSKFTVELPARTLENTETIERPSFMNNKIEMINIEFSDIYSND